MIKRIRPIPCFASERGLLLSLKFLFGFLQTGKKSKRESPRRLVLALCASAFRKFPLLMVNNRISVSLEHSKGSLDSAAAQTVN
jgi:hypothetical protein